MNPPKRVVNGDVFAVPLPGVGFAYARECFGSCICVYDVITAKVVTPFNLTLAKPAFWTGFFWHGGVKNGDWPIVLRQKLTEEDGWGPPTKELAIYRDGPRRVWHKGRDRMVPDAETKDMSITGSMSPKGLIEEILSRRSEFRTLATEDVRLDPNSELDLSASHNKGNANRTKGRLSESQSRRVTKGKRNKTSK